jgi:glycosyltransferase involved in cell wall biosynthesis
MAIAKWITRQDTSFKKAVSSLFFNVSKKITNLQHAPNLGVFRAIRREAIEKVKSIPETTGTVLSLMYWSGLSYATVELNRDPRFAGTSGYNLKKMLALTADRIFSYSLFPIKVATYFGVFMGLMSILLGMFFIVQKFALDSVVPGWTSLIVLSLFLFGLNFVFMGLIGEYLGRIYMESKGRPRYITETIIDSTRKDTGR